MEVENFMHDVDFKNFMKLKCHAQYSSFPLRLCSIQDS